MKGRAFAAQAALVLAQALTAWALLVHLVGGHPDVLTVGFGLAAFLVPLRHNGTSRDRAKTCFSASLALTTVIAFRLIMELMGGGMSSATMLFLTATVLFSLAGGLYWVRRDQEND